MCLSVYFSFGTSEVDCCETLVSVLTCLLVERMINTAQSFLTVVCLSVFETVHMAVDGSN